MIYENYVSIMFIYHPFNSYGLSVSNSRHSMLALRKDINVLIYKGMQENISTNCVRIFGNLQQFNHLCLD